MIVILGIDPGTSVIGYALLETESREPRLLYADCINLEQTAPDERLLALHKNLNHIIKKHRPPIAAVERIFFSKNIKTALSVSEARGVILLTTALAGLTVFEYTPLEVKKSVTGDGNADKAQVEKMIRLSIKEAEKLIARDDVFDAIAIALTCASRTRSLLFLRNQE